MKALILMIALMSMVGGCERSTIEECDSTFATLFPDTKYEASSMSRGGGRIHRMYTTKTKVYRCCVGCSSFAIRVYLTK